MAENIENKVGLQGCYWKENDKLFSVSKGGTFILYTNNSNEFSVDERCVGGKTKNPKETVSKARWAFIYEFFFQKLEKAKQEDISENLWGPLSGGTDNVAKYGLGTKYKQGSKLIFKPESYSYYYGYKQRVELFTESPGTGFYFYIIPVDKPQISFAYFTKSEEVKHYGENVSLQIMLHAYNLDKKNKYKAKLYLLEEDIAKGLKETDDFEDNNLWKEPRVYNIENGASGDNWNSYINLNFPIDIEWKKDQKSDKNFTVVLEVYKFWVEPGMIYGTNNKEERVNYKNYADDPTTDLVEYDPEILGLKDIDNKKSISSRFIVSKELMGDYLKRIEQDKNNMIQYIGDIEYSLREFDPCGYSKITIKDEDDKDRESFVIFDETAAVGAIDKTKQSFAIITGDTRKNISITLDQLTTQDTFCQGLLLDQGQKHSEKKNVFQVDKVYAALKNGNDHVRRTDATHQEQQKNAGVATTKENENDTDVVKTNSSYNAGVAQQWRESVDYKIDSNEKITLMLRYMYNKTAFESLQNPDNKNVNAGVNLLWIFRYFWFTDDTAQTYFLPVSTCRYPNQLVKINVWPDIEWEVSFIISTNETHTLSFGKKEDLTNYPAGQGLRFSDKFKTKSEYKGFSFSTDISAKINGNVHKLGFEKIENIIKKLADLKEFLDKFNSDNSANASTGGFKEYFSFKLVSPNIVLAFKWNMGSVVEKENNHRAVTMLSGAFKLAPLIGINFEVDLFVITDSIKVYGIGDITKFIRKAIEWVTETDIYLIAYVNIELNGEFTIVYNSINGIDNKKSNKKAILSIPFGVKGGIKSNEENVIILPTGEKKEKFEAEISINSGIEITEELGTDNTGPYKKNSYVFKGLNVKVVIIENVFSRNKLSVIPKIDETFEVMKEDKICPESIEYLNNKKDEK
ncbi:hypothetical protein [Chryseobacterium sp.]|uniref:hypothetical protein n=1 Tax=Chryseobacterium sp. TaxID=1871047 RepID=UPI000EC1AED7|nr:hypothetical protein [Chryseobacterium sp.]HCM36072.1 hypothetical protein [Chryseobacterium sp.]